MSRRTPIAPAARTAPSTTPLKPLEPIVVSPSEAFTEALFAEIQRLEQARQEAHRFPDYPLYRELVAHVGQALNALYRDGRIHVGSTINDKYITTQTDKYR